MQQGILRSAITLLTFASFIGGPAVLGCTSPAVQQEHAHRSTAPLVSEISEADLESAEDSLLMQSDLVATRDAIDVDMDAKPGMRVTFVDGAEPLTAVYKGPGSYEVRADDGTVVYTHDVVQNGGAVPVENVTFIGGASFQINGDTPLDVAYDEMSFGADQGNNARANAVYAETAVSELNFYARSMNGVGPTPPPPPPSPDAAPPPDPNADASAPPPPPPMDAGPPQLTPKAWWVPVLIVIVVVGLVIEAHRQYNASASARASSNCEQLAQNGAGPLVAPLQTLLPGVKIVGTAEIQRLLTTTKPFFCVNRQDAQGWEPSISQMDDVRVGRCAQPGSPPVYFDIAGAPVCGRAFVIVDRRTQTQWTSSGVFGIGGTTTTVNCGTGQVAFDVPPTCVITPTPEQTAALAAGGPGATQATNDLKQQCLTPDRLANCQVPFVVPANVAAAADAGDQVIVR